MAKNGDRGGGPGTYVTGGVRCTMDAPFKKGMAKGSQRDMSGTFDKPRSGGDNGLPTRVTDSMGGAKGTPNHGPATDSPSKQGYAGTRRA